MAKEIVETLGENDHTIVQGLSSVSHLWHLQALIFRKVKFKDLRGKVRKNYKEEDSRFSRLYPRYYNNECVPIKRLCALHKTSKYVYHKKFNTDQNAEIRKLNLMEKKTST